MFWIFVRIASLCSMRNKNKIRPILHISQLISYSVQQQNHFNGNVLRNKCCRCNEGSLYTSYHYTTYLNLFFMTLYSSFTSKKPTLRSMHLSRRYFQKYVLIETRGVVHTLKQSHRQPEGCACFKGQNKCRAIQSGHGEFYWEICC